MIHRCVTVVLDSASALLFGAAFAALGRGLLGIAFCAASTAFGITFLAASAGVGTASSHQAGTRQECGDADPCQVDYVRVVKEVEPAIWGYIEIDLGQWDQKTAIRKRLEKLGISPIPVFHTLRDPISYLRKLSRQYDRVAIGSWRAYEFRLPMLFYLWQVCRTYPDVWYHLLGYTPDHEILAFPAHSGDSLTWYDLVKYGHYSERAMLKRFSGLSFKGIGGDSDLIHKGIEISGIIADGHERNWRHMINRMASYE